MFFRHRLDTYNRQIELTQHNPPVPEDLLGNYKERESIVTRGKQAVEVSMTKRPIYEGESTPPVLH